MKKSLLTLATIAMMAQNVNAMYVIGDPFGKWDPGVGTEMEEIENGWQWTGYIPYFRFFGFATELKPGMDWVTFNNNYRLSPEKDFIDAEDGNYPLHFGSPEASFCGLGKTCTLTVTKDEKGEYYVSIKNKEMPEEETWGMIGDFNGWNYDKQMHELNPNIWCTVFSSIEGNFKFRATRTGISNTVLLIPLPSQEMANIRSYRMETHSTVINSTVRPSSLISIQKGLRPKRT